MAFDEVLAERVRALLAADGVEVREQKMFGGISFMVGGSYACGVSKDRLVVRVGAEREAEALARPGVQPMDFTGRPLKGWIYVTASALDDDRVLGEWVSTGVAYAKTQRPSLRSRKGSQAAAVYPRRGPGRGGAR